MSYFYAFKNRIDFAGSGLSEAKKSDIVIAVNIAGEVYSAYRRVMYENSGGGVNFAILSPTDWHGFLWQFIKS